MELPPIVEAQLLMNNKPLATRYYVAEKVMSIYCKIPNVNAIILAGSVAAGLADDYSDIEIGVLIIDNFEVICIFNNHVRNLLGRSSFKRMASRLSQRKF